MPWSGISSSSAGKKTTMQPSTTETELYSDTRLSPGVQELLGYKPHWVIRRGNVALLLLVTLLIGLSWFIQIPEMISSNIILPMDPIPVTGTKMVSCALPDWKQGPGKIKAGQNLIIGAGNAPAEEELQGVIVDILPSGAPSQSLTIKVEFPDIPRTDRILTRIITGGRSCRCKIFASDKLFNKFLGGLIRLR